MCLLACVYEESNDADAEGAAAAAAAGFRPPLSFLCAGNNRVGATHNLSN